MIKKLKVYPGEIPKQPSQSVLKQAKDKPRRTEKAKRGSEEATSKKEKTS
jgi:hypothetical protein